MINQYFIKSVSFVCMCICLYFKIHWQIPPNKRDPFQKIQCNNYEYNPISSAASSVWRGYKAHKIQIVYNPQSNCPIEPFYVLFTYGISIKWKSFPNDINSGKQILLLLLLLNDSAFDIFSSLLCKINVYFLLFCIIRSRFVFDFYRKRDQTQINRVLFV